MNFLNRNITKQTFHVGDTKEKKKVEEKFLQVTISFTSRNIWMRSNCKMQEMEEKNVLIQSAYGKG